METRFNPNRLTPYLFLAPAAGSLIVGLLYPIGYMIYASFRESLWATLEFAGAVKG